MSVRAGIVGSGFVASLARPGGDITGLTNDPTPEVQSKRLELFKEAVPTAARVALLWNPLPPPRVSPASARAPPRRRTAHERPREG